MALTKNEMIAKLTEQTEMDKKKAADSIETIIEIMKSTLASGEDVLVSGFGKFCINEKNTRKGRNPATGDSMLLNARRVVTFKCAGKLRNKIN